MIRIVNAALLDSAGLARVLLTRYAAPVTEETLKAVFIVVMLRRRRVGFLVDGAILGFAVGTGFALVENLEHLGHSSAGSVLFWISRGFGTAVLHGATTAVFAAEKYLKELEEAEHEPAASAPASVPS